MKKTFIVTTAVLGLSSALFAFGAGGMCTKKDGMGMKMIMKQLDLSSEQKTQLKALKESNKEERKANREVMKEKRKAHQELRKEMLAKYMSAEGFDKAGFVTAAKAKAAERQAQMKEKMEARLTQKVDKLEKVSAILAPEQRVKWVKLM